MTEYEFTSIDFSPLISKMYKDIDDDYKITNLDTSYFDLPVTIDGVETTRCPLLKAVWNILVDNFELYYDTREIGGQTEYDFFCIMQSCLNRNADTLERQLKVYNDDIANPILGRKEIVTYDTTDKRDADTTVDTTYGRTTTDTESGQNVDHHVEVPADSPNNDTDRSRDKTSFGHVNTEANSGVDTDHGVNDETRKMTGTVTTELSDLGVRPNYESLNGFLENNKTFIQFFIETFEKCFAPRYQRVYF